MWNGGQQNDKNQYEKESNEESWEGLWKTEQKYDKRLDDYDIMKETAWFQSMKQTNQIFSNTKAMDYVENQVNTKHVLNNCLFK